MGEQPPTARVVNERVYVAVGEDVEQSRSTLQWALDNFDGHFRILHVHQPHRIDHTAGQLRDDEVRARRELERENMHKTLDTYISICNQAEVYAEKRFLEMRDIGKGIVELIEQHAVTKLVMGAAADIHYDESITELKSSKAIFVDLHAHPSCQIWFTCRSRLICRREGDLNTFDMDVTPSSLPPNPTQTISRSPQSSTDSSGVDEDLVMVPSAHERGESSRSIILSASTPSSEGAPSFPPLTFTGHI